VNRQSTTHDALDTTTSKNKKKTTKDLHQTYAAAFLSVMSVFRAKIDRRTKKRALDYVPIDVMWPPKRPLPVAR
jgi:hypothetical protein